MSDLAPLKPTFHGFIKSTMDGLVLFEACLVGKLPHVARRPHDRERSELIKSGNVFIYEERASGIKRWTDGVSWSPSRILGNFLLYRELDKPFQPGEKKRAMKKRPSAGVNKVTATSGAHSHGCTSLVASSAQSAFSGSNGNMCETERAFVGSLVDSYQFKPNGLIKKTISIQYRDVHHHLVSYYTLEDVASGALATPSMDPSLRSITPRHALLHCSSFRAPVDDQDFAGNDSRFVHMYQESSEFPPPMMPAIVGMPPFANNAWATNPPYLTNGAYPYGQQSGSVPSSSMPSGSVYSYDQHQPAPYRLNGTSQASHGYDPEAMMQEQTGHPSALAAPSENGHVDYPPLHFDRSMGPGAPAVSGYTLPGIPLPPSVIDAPGVFEPSGSSHSSGHEANGANGYSPEAISQHNRRYNETYGHDSGHSHQNGDIHGALEPSPFHSLPSGDHQVSDFGSLPDHAMIFTSTGQHHATSSDFLDLGNDESSSSLSEQAKEWNMAGGSSY